ncbi:hypothetical protein C8Q75DRAFT_771636 [Abortiporus biennis]|nr:hypothetical protein C8Q75DRAFT_771636 [Abortiporus biennis]
MSNSPNVTHQSEVEPSGTLDQVNASQDIFNPQANSPISIDKSKSELAEGEEQALEWHEVIELQAFSERKVWIEEKIKMLEKMPPIEVFVGLDAVRSSAETVPGLPSREELKEWIAEHDRIEKETEIFDSGELRKLKKFTKAAAQRNLSPADTDLIEITLTTIYSLDKLLHLLRDRSEHLDLLGVRLTWEEKRIAAWIELRSTVADIKNFLNNRARWSPTVYDDVDSSIKEDDSSPLTFPSPKSSSRRGSVVSVTSIASDGSVPSLGISRGARFQLAEQLSREAAQIASRVSTLRHSKIHAAGKALDKLIDGSRKPVPDELLDEQDRLEDKGINDMEDVGKFIMSIVMQWKKADEVYVETVKDKAGAQTLIEEIETAKLSHPTPRQDASFLSKSNALSKRLFMRGNPASSTSTFPRPTHRLFPEQQASNEFVAEFLSTEFLEATEATRKAELAAKQYHAMFEAVKKVESHCKASSELTSSIQSLTSLLEGGFETFNGDGSPPDLSSEACLQASRHAAFIALMPSALEQLQQKSRDAESLLPLARQALLDLDHPGVDLQFVADSTTTVDRLTEAQKAASVICKQVVARMSTLEEVRGLWGKMEELFRELEDVRNSIADDTEKAMWRQQVGEDVSLLTPESPATTLPSSESVLPNGTAFTRLKSFSAQLQNDVSTPLSLLSPALGTHLRVYLEECLSALKSSESSVRKIQHLLDAMRQQTAIMTSIQADVHTLQERMDELMIKYDAGVQDVLAGTVSQDDATTLQHGLNTELSQLQKDVEALVDGLSSRIPFVSTGEISSLAACTPSKKSFAIKSAFGLDTIERFSLTCLSVDPAAVDRGVRADSNAYCMALAGTLESLSHKADHFRLAQMAHAIDVAVESVLQSLEKVEQELLSLQVIVDESCTQPMQLEQISILSSQLGDISSTKLHLISASYSSIRELLHTLDNEADGRELASMVTSRRKAVDAVGSRYSSWKDKAENLHRQITEARRREEAREAEAALQAERERAEAEARRKAEADRQRLEAEAKEREDKLRLEAAEREREERERLEAEAKEREQRMRLEAEEQLRAERVRMEAEAREREDQARLEAERKAKEEQVRLDAERVEREAKAKLEAEKREQKEQERLAAEGREQAKLKAEARERELEALEREDVFGIRVASSSTRQMTSEISQLKSHIYFLRKRLHSLGINELARPGSRGASDSLPSADVVKNIENSFSDIVDEVSQLPKSVDEDQVAAELRSLHSEISSSQEMLQYIRRLSQLCTLVFECDNALSDLLEHIDSYPSPPIGPLTSPHTSDTSKPPEEQLADRLRFTDDLVDRMVKALAFVSEDRRATAEHERIQQTWSELRSMGEDRINGARSRPSSVLSTGRGSRASVIKTRPPPVPVLPKKSAGYSNLSAGSPGGKFLTPPAPSARRAASGSAVKVPNRSSSRLSVASTSTRSVSGPMDVTSRLYNSTFASRQRTNSVTSTLSPPSVSKRVFPSPSRPRAQTGQDRVASPAFSDVSSISHSRSSMSISRPSLSRSSWSRAPRQSFPLVARSPPRVRSQAARKPYIANPKSKLDMAVGDVVNKLPANMNINVEVVEEGWKDQSGKYWIGDQDPKLCFCRILRSQTVMVRVGGGWAELSKFIKDHFADAFRLLPESPPRARVREEKWISSATLSQAMEEMEKSEADTSYEPPRTPEPLSPFIPSLALSTPSGRSPRSIKSSPSVNGSPLTALQFIRRADRESPSLRPETPTKSTRSVASSIMSTTPASLRQPVWRP